MSCEICGRDSCTRSFHSIEAQERFDAKQDMSDDVDDLREAILTLRAELEQTKADHEYDITVMSRVNTELRNRAETAEALVHEYKREKLLCVRHGYFKVDANDPECPACAAEAELAKYKRISESGESLGGELEERERRIELEAECERLNKIIEERLQSANSCVRYLLDIEDEKHQRKILALAQHAESYKNDRDRLQAKLQACNEQLSRYEQGVEVYNVRVERVFNNFEQLTKCDVRFQLPSKYIGQRVRVLVMAEGGE